MYQDRIPKNTSNNRHQNAHEIDYEIFSLPIKEVRIISKEKENDESFLLEI